MTKAGPPGLEPGTSVLETEILPLNYRPFCGLILPLSPPARELLLRFLMLLMYFAPLAVLGEVNLSINALFVLLITG